MNKAELIEQIAQPAEISKAAAERALDALVGASRSSLKKGEMVTLVGFGTFYVGKRAARTGRNPRTGAAIKIKAARVPQVSRWQGTEGCDKLAPLFEAQGRRSASRGCLAQLVERRPYTANVGGSIPSAPTRHATRSTIGVVVQLVRIPACHAGGRGFESRPLRQISHRAPYRSP